MLVALIFEFGRPQDFLPPLKVIPFPSLIDVSLALAVIFSGKSSFANKQTKLWIGLLVFMTLWVPFANNNFRAFMTLKDMVLYFCLYFGNVTFVNTTDRCRSSFSRGWECMAFLESMGSCITGRGLEGG